ncbi:PAS domain S-box protein [Ornithinimicrobium sp. Arc0846-15]|nr:PAS domain S-box protein [Ornithinimicrobium laminariae]
MNNTHDRGAADSHEHRQLFSDYVEFNSKPLIWLSGGRCHIAHANQAAFDFCRVASVAALQRWFDQPPPNPHMEATSHGSTADRSAAQELQVIVQVLKASDGDLQAALATVGGLDAITTQPCRIGDQTGVVIEVNRRAERLAEPLDPNLPERLMYEFLDNTPACLFIKDRQGRYLLANRNFQATFHLSHRQIIGCTDSQIIDDQDSADRLRANDLDVLERNRVREFEERIFIKGKWRTYRAVKFPIRDASGAAFALGAVASDMTEIVEAQDQLQMSERQFRESLDQAGEGVCLTSPDGTIEVVNQSFCRMIGLREAELVGTSLDGYRISAGRPSDETLRTGSAEEHSRGARLERQLRRRDGKPIDVVISTSAVRDNTGTTRRYMSHIIDVTDQRALESRLRHGEKLEAIGQLAGGITHDINNLLGGILGYTELLQMDLPGNDTATEACEQIVRTTQRAADFTSRLLAFARSTSRERVIFDVHEILRESIEILSRTIDPMVRIETNLTAAYPIVEGDPGQMQGAILNLALNARDAVGEEGIITFSTEVTIEEGREPTLTIRVHDDGVGIGEEHLPRVFDPFYTTKDPGQGTGLGLMSVSSAAHALGGTVKIESSQGSGTTVTMEVPVHEASTVETDVVCRESARPEPGGACTILLVDDDDAIRGVTGGALRRLGHSVVEAGDGVAAMDALDELAEPPDLVILDVMMPRMSGRELHAQIRRRFPRVPLIVVSGFFVEDDVADLHDHAIAGTLQKPFRMSELVDAVNQAVHGG